VGVGVQSSASMTCMLSIGGATVQHVQLLCGRTGVSAPPVYLPPLPPQKMHCERKPARMPTREVCYI
jgi:hypothetical protein